MDDSITLKGIKQGLLVTVKPDGRWPDLAGRLMTLIDPLGNSLPRRPGHPVAWPARFAAQRSGDIQAQLARRDVTLAAVLSDSFTTTGSRRMGLKTAPTDGFRDGCQCGDALKPPPIDPEERGSDGVLIRSTLRSGAPCTARTRGGGGSVNAGAMIVAGGCHCLGRLRSRPRGRQWR